MVMFWILGEEKIVWSTFRREVSAWGHGKPIFAPDKPCIGINLRPFSNIAEGPLIVRGALSKKSLIVQVI